jgi:hypothetical protein
MWHITNSSVSLRSFVNRYECFRRTCNRFLDCLSLRRYHNHFKHWELLAQLYSIISRQSLQHRHCKIFVSSGLCPLGCCAVQAGLLPTSVTYQPTLCKNQEEQRCQLHYSESLKYMYFPENSQVLGYGKYTSQTHYWKNPRTGSPFSTILHRLCSSQQTRR